MSKDDSGKNENDDDDDDDGDYDVNDDDYDVDDMTPVNTMTTRITYDKLPAMTAMMMTMTMITAVSKDASKAYDVNRRQHH